MMTHVLKIWKWRRTGVTAAWTSEPQHLMEVCERYWASPWNMISVDTGEDGLQAQYARARQELLARPAEGIAWALALAAGDEPQPRSLGIELLAQAVYRECLGADEDNALHTFIEVLERPLRSRWDQIALETATGALGVLGYECAVPALTRILQSDDREYQGDTHWCVASALERITGQSFLHSSNPVEAARLWAHQLY